MEYIIVIDMKLVIVGLVCAVGFLAASAGIHSKNKTAIICGLTGWGLIFPLAYFLGRALN